MFSRVVALALVALPVLAAATPLEGRGEPGTSCTTGPIQCCDSVEQANDPQVQQILASLGLTLAADILVGLTCSPINIIGVGSGNSCNAQAVCCQDNNVGGLLSIGCAPVTL